MSETFHTEKLLSCQIPAIALLINSGFHYLGPIQISKERGGRLSNVFLENIEHERLMKFNSFQYLERTYPFSEANIWLAMERLKAASTDGLQRSNAAVYRLLTRGTTLEQTVNGDTKSHSLHYIDWKTPSNNVFHVAAGFEVERSRSRDTARPDLVLFVNGIPFAVIECTAPEFSVEEAIARMIRNQSDEYVPGLFATVQIVIAINEKQARYACVGTRAKFWSAWHEDLPESPLTKQLQALIKTDLDHSIKAELFEFAQSEHTRHVTDFNLQQERAPYSNREQVSAQDQTLYALCRPQRLLELAYAYTIFNGGQRQITRYHQFFAVRRAMASVRQIDQEGRRKGGIVWHAQGAGKSQTMVMLARQLALAADIVQPRIVFITERNEIASHLGNTFEECAMHPGEARSLGELIAMVGNPKAQVITSRAHKFTRAASLKKHSDESAEIFVLVDESHRTPLGEYANEMRRIFPRLCYIGFTGTPLTEKEREQTLSSLGGFIDIYPSDKAVEDRVVLPVLYEARHIPLEHDQAAMERWFERHARNLGDHQKTRLHEHYAKARTLPFDKQLNYLIALDVSAHFSASYKGSGLKGQLVAPSKHLALTYKNTLDELGIVTSALLIFSPKTPEGLASPDEEDEEQDIAMERFWRETMVRYGNEAEYDRLTIEQFDRAPAPEILIVVDKCLNNFSVPQNAVLYLARPLSGHALLQAIARVNRLFDDASKEEQDKKPFGIIIDYTGMLGDLDKKLTLYPELQEFDEFDLRGVLIGADLEIKKLPRQRAALWEIFRDVENHDDREHLQRTLRDETLRTEFHARLANFTRTLEVALGNDNFLMDTPAEDLRQYEQDLCRFHQLKTTATLRFGENLDFRQEYTPKVAKLLHPPSEQLLRQLTPINIFHEKSFQATLLAYGLTSTAAKADASAYNTRKAIRERLAQDPAFYEIFAKQIQQVIDEYHARRIGDDEFLRHATDIKDAVVHHRLARVPVEIRDNEDAIVFHAAIFPILESAELRATDEQRPDLDAYAAGAALEILKIFAKHRKEKYWSDIQTRRDTESAIDDYLCDVVEKEAKIALTSEQKNDLIGKIMRLAGSRAINGED